MAVWRKLGFLGGKFSNTTYLPFKFRKALDIINSIPEHGGNSFALQHILFDSATITGDFGLPTPRLLPSNNNAGYIQSDYSLIEMEFYTQPVLLRDADQFSMAAGLEVRSPFMDSDLVDFTLALPDYLKLGYRPKDLLISSFKRDLPTVVYDRKKQGFTLPWNIWMRGELRSFCENNLIGFSNRIESKKIMLEWDRFLNGKSEIGWSRFWSIVSLEYYLERNEIIISQ
jgi:hypothetical protein